MQALGLKLLRTIDRPEYKVVNPLFTKHYYYLSSMFMNESLAPSSIYKALLNLPLFCVASNLQYTIAILGYAEEDQTTILELTYNYGVTEYTKGNAYAQVDLFCNLFHIFSNQSISAILIPDTFVSYMLLDCYQY